MYVWFGIIEALDAFPIDRNEFLEPENDVRCVCNVEPLDQMAMQKRIGWCLLGNPGTAYVPQQERDPANDRFPPSSDCVIT